jgi:methyltransferase (TIGR00027 family)
MQDARPSRTAMRVAMRRAAHQIFDAPPRVLDDPLALPIVGGEAVAKLEMTPALQRGRLARALRAFMAVRSRVAEDALARAVERGVAQYVILGAGLDTFPYRNPYPSSALRVFEVDHPATQAWKRRRLEAAAIAIPASVTFAPVDFERQTLADGLAAAGFNRRAPAFFSWLGVTMYLSDDAFASTLAYVASTPAGGGLVFDYAVPRKSLGWMSRLALDAIARRVAQAGEPFRTFFDPGALQDRLLNAGFRSLEDLGPDELNARYFKGRPDGLRVSGNLGRIASAEI